MQKFTNCVGVSVGKTGFMSLRYFDGAANAWYDSLKLSDSTKDYVVPIQYMSWCDAKKRQVNVRCDILNANYVLDNYDIYALTYAELDVTSMVVVTEAMRQTSPQIWG